MAHTVTPVYETRDGARHILFADVTVSSVDTVTGEPITPSANISAGGLGMSTLLMLSNAPLTSNGRYCPVFDHASGKMRYFLPGQSGGSVPESWPDVMGGVFAAQTASGAAATNGAAIIALVTATATAKTTILAQPNALDAEVVGRNIVISLKSATGGALPAACGTATLAGTAPDGSAQTEIVDLTPLNGVVLGVGGIVYIPATKAFATLTSLTPSVSLISVTADVQISAGPGSVFGLRSTITAESDIKSVRKDATAIAASVYIGTTGPSQLDMGADVADGVDILVVYQASVSEAPAGAAVGTVRIRAEGY